MRTCSFLLLMLLVCTAIIAGCTVPSSPSSKPVITSSQPAVQSATPIASGSTYVVHVTATSFDRWDLEVKTGDTVIWVNEDKMLRRVVHLPTNPTGSELFNSGPLSPGGTFRYTFTNPGRYVYGDPQHGGGRSPYVNVSD